MLFILSKGSNSNFKFHLNLEGLSGFLFFNIILLFLLFDTTVFFIKNCFFSLCYSSSSFSAAASFALQASTFIAVRSSSTLGEVGAMRMLLSFGSSP